MPAGFKLMTLFNIVASVAALPERYRAPDPASMPWCFQADGALQWMDPAQQQGALP